MNRGRLNFVLIVLLGVVVAAHFWFRRDVRVRNYEILPEMAESLAAESQDPNPVFPNGQTLQVPPKGTIARGFLPLDFGAPPADGGPPGVGLVNPIQARLETRRAEERRRAVALDQARKALARLEGSESGAAPAKADPAALEAARKARDAAEAAHQTAIKALATAEKAVRERGQRVFTTFCAPCHGVRADGESVLAKRGIPRKSLLTPQVQRPEPGLPGGLTDGQIFAIMTSGRGVMAGYASQIPREDRWYAILYLRRLQTTAHASP